MKTCFFLGHRDAPDSLRPLLEESIVRHITAYGVTHFTVGQHGRFDALVMQALREAKRRHPVTLSLLLAYHPFDRPVEVPEWFDDTFYPPGMEQVPKRAAIMQANRYMIRNSDYLICFDRGQVGNTRELVEVARRRELNGMMQVENLVVQSKHLY